MQPPVGSPVTTAETTVLLFGEHTLSRYGLRAALLSQPGITVIAEADCPATGFELVAYWHPDVVVLDTAHPGRQACRITQALADTRPAPAVLIVTNENCPCIPCVLVAGARGVILKHVQPLELAGAVRSVASGYTVVPDGIIRPLYTTNYRLARSCDPAKLASLSARELEVLRCVVTGDSNAQIARRLHISEGTVKCHIQHMLNKLGLPDRVHAVIYAYETGFVDRVSAFAEDQEAGNGAPVAPRPSQAPRGPGSTCQTRDRCLIVQR